ncbi:unnamed protein product [Urochloa humidicola]
MERYCYKAGLLALAAALLAAAARADGDSDKPWKCFRSCTKDCHHRSNDDAAANKDGRSSWIGNVSTVVVVVSAVSGGECKTVSGSECKSGCHDDECFEGLPAIGYPQCVYTACLSYPHYKRHKRACLKNCCEKCFPRHSPPSPGPAPEPPSPTPPGPAPTPEPPSPTPPGPTPEPPSPTPPGPAPEPPSPTPPEPEPGPTPTPVPPSPPN